MEIAYPDSNLPKSGNQFCLQFQIGFGLPFAILVLMPLLVSAQCPAPSYANNPSGCANTSVTLAVTSYNDPSVTQHRWYTSQTGWDQITPSRQFSPNSGVWTSQLDGSFSSNITYWVSSVCNGSESSTRKSVTFTMTPPGNLTISTGGTPPYLCIGNSITLTPQGGTNYSWSSNPAGASGSGSITVSPTVNTTYTLSGKESVCNTSTSTSLTVSVSPKVGPVTITGSTALCQASGATTYTASATDAYSYQWTLSPGSGSISTSGVVTWNASFVGTATVGVTAFSQSNCNYTTTSSLPVNISAFPSAADAGPDQTGAATCGLTTVTLAANAPAVGTGSWSVVSGAGGSFGNASSPGSTFSGTAGTTYTLRWTISNGPCTPSTDNVVITFNKIPTAANAGADQTGSSTCGLTSVTLSANSPTVGSGLWSIVSGSGGSLGNPASASSGFNGTAGSTYTLRWTISNSPCTPSADEVVVTFNRNPTAANAGSDQAGTQTCGLTSVPLSGNAPSVGTGLWSVVTGAGGSFTDATSPATTFAGTEGVAYNLKWTISNSPCTSSSDNVSVSLSTVPTTSPAVTAAECYGPCSPLLSASGAGAGEGYKWYSPSGALLSSASTYQAPVVSATTANYCYVRLENANGCVGPQTWVNVTIYPVPVVTAEGGNQYLSYGNKIRLSVGSYYSYQWRKDNIDVAGATAQIYDAAEPGQYSVRVKGSSGAPEATSAQFFVYDAIPSQDQNYISTITFQKEGVNTAALFTLKPEHYAQATSYFDGLGRPMQTVVTMGSPSKRDLVTPVVYDQFGREFRKYLPFVPDENASDKNTGRYKDNATIIGANGDYTGIASGFYDTPATKVADDDGDMPFSETVFEASPLNRVIEQGAPGSQWQPATGHAIKMSYETNATGEVLLWRYSAPTDTHPLGLVYPTTATAPNTPVHYDANQLFRNVTKDEQDHEVIEYKDKEGKVVLKRVQAVNPPLTLGSDTDYASTYYIYDDFGQLVCVMPPEATKRLATQYYQTGSDDDSKETFLERWAFRYRYDERKRMIMKEVPGADSLRMVYDARDRLVFTQDGKQRNANEWLFTKYDELNRPVVNGIYTHGSTVDQRQMRALLSTTILSETYDGSTSNYGYTNNVFPTSACEVLTVTYYDNYDFKSPLITDPNGDFNFKSDEIVANGGLEAQEQQEFGRVAGQVTGSQTRVLESSTFLWTVNYYDDRYRLVQTTSSNNKGGVSRLTNVYDFVGKVLRTKTRYIIPGHATNPDTKIYQRFSYDHAGRLLKAWHQIEGGPEVVISSNEYNELGQLVAKKLHQTTLDATPVAAEPLADAASTTYDADITSSDYSASSSVYVASNSIRLLPGFTVPLNSDFTAKIGYSSADALTYNNAIEGEYLQAIDYRYNIRGWLRTINDPSDPMSDDLFNMELAYNTPSSNGGAAQFNGNISEAVWKSAGLDKQSYGYSYDPMNRLTEGLYYDLAKPIQSGRYDEKIGDAGQSLQAYDLNGNIQNLLRNGKIDVGTYGLMDNMHYDYGGANQSGGNKLMYVSDAQATGAQEEGFKEIVEGTTDYLYDENGNLTKDENKGVIGIEYNHLNLPSKVSKSATEYLVYTYDATGRKLAQQVFGTEAKTTEYVGELVFEDDALQFVLQPEGRVVKDIDAGAPDPWEYQYFLKDHLGNTRVVFSEKKSSTEYKATLEDNTQGDEMSMFFNYPTGGTRSSLNEFDHTDAGTTYTHSQLLTGSNTNRVGLARSFEVNPGDVFDLEVYAKYEAPSATSADVTTLLSQLSVAFSLGSATSPLDGAPAQAAFDNLFQGGAPWINSSMWDDIAPKAYLNYILFDENFVLVDFGFDQISTEGEQVGVTPVVPHDYLSLHVKVAQRGYLYVYLSNEQPTLTNVYFDDMKIVQYSAVEQISDYYPFGLTFNSYQRENSVDQRWKFQGQEHIDDLGLNWDSFKWRNHQPDIGRFFNVDPLAEKYVYNSPYAFSENKVTSHVELEGLEAMSAFSQGEIDATINGQMGEGLVESVTDVAEGVYNLVTDPIGTAATLGTAIGNLVSDPIGTFTAIKDQTVSSFKENPQKAMGKVIGNMMMAVVTEGVVTEANATSDVAQVTKTVATVEKTVDKTVDVSKTTSKLSKVEKSTTTTKIGDKFTKTTEVRPSTKAPGQSRAEYVRYKNQNGKVIRTYKDSYDRANTFQHRKSLTGGPEGRSQ